MTELLYYQEFNFASNSATLLIRFLTSLSRTLQRLFTVRISCSSSAIFASYVAIETVEVSNNSIAAAFKAILVVFVPIATNPVSTKSTVGVIVTLLVPATNVVAS